MKSILVKYETWKELQYIKADENLRSMEDVLLLLLKCWNEEKK